MPGSKRLPHEILGVPRDAGPDELRRVFRTLAKRHHPDAGGEREAFAAVKEAYDAMTSGHAPALVRVRVEGVRQDPPAAALVNGVGRLAAGLGMRRDGRIVRPRIRFRIGLALDRVVLGAEVDLDYGGSVWPVRIPPGTRAGQHLQDGTLRVGGRDHDWVLDVRLLPDPRFVVKGSDVEAAVGLGVYDMILGGVFPIDGPAGERLEFAVPPGFAGGDLRIRGAGIPRSPGSTDRGDMVVSVVPSMPGPPDPVEQDLLRRLRDAARGDVGS